MTRTLLIGDVHGCIDELRALLRACAAQPSDRVVLVGDLVAKGPDSQAVVQFARESGLLAVRGNHDEHVLRAREAVAQLKPWHREVVQTLREEDWAYLGALPFWLRLPEGVVAVHGGLVPGVALEAQRPEDLVSMRSLREDGRATRRIEGVPWASVWQGPEHVVFGHDAIRGLQLYPHATGLDTGCVYGRELTALILPERRLVSVPARRAYALVPD